MRRSALTLLVPLVSGCITLRANEVVAGETRDAPEAAARPALAMSVSAAHGQWIDGWYTFAADEPVSAAELERQRELWQESGRFAEVRVASVEEPAPLQVRVRLTHDTFESSVLGDLEPFEFVLFGARIDLQLTVDASFYRAGQFVTEITRVERLYTYNHVLLLPLAPFATLGRAERSAEADLVRSVLAEAQRRGVP